jgi:putative transposase
MADGAVVERGMLTAQDEAWDAAVRQAEVIEPLAEKGTVGLADADEAAAMLRPAAGRDHRTPLAHR